MRNERIQSDSRSSGHKQQVMTSALTTAEETAHHAVGHVHLVRDLAQQLLDARDVGSLWRRAIQVP